jgi:hypothetical protein
VSGGGARDQLTGRLAETNEVEARTARPHAYRGGDRIRQLTGRTREPSSQIQREHQREGERAREPTPHQQNSERKERM